MSIDPVESASACSRTTRRRPSRVFHWVSTVSVLRVVRARSSSQPRSPALSSAAETKSLFRNSSTRRHADQCDERMIRVRDLAVLAEHRHNAYGARSNCRRCSFWLRSSCGLEIRHALGDAAQRFGVGPGGLKLPAGRFELLPKPRRLERAGVDGLPERRLEFRERILRSLLRDPMALCLRAQLAVAIGDDGSEPGALRRVLSRDLFECLKRGLQLIERLTDLTILAGDPMKLRLAGRPGEFVGLPLLVDDAVQMTAIDPGSCRAGARSVSCSSWLCRISSSFARSRIRVLRS